MQKKDNEQTIKSRVERIPKEERKKLIETDPDFIDCPKFDNSLENLLSKTKYADGVEDYQASKFLHMTVDEYLKTVKMAILALRGKLVKND